MTRQFSKDKVDANQGEIVKALKSVGVSVEVIKKPVDLMICCRGETSLMEVKNPDGKDTITKEQADFIARWPGKIHIVRTPMEAVKAAVGEKYVT